MKHYLAVYAMPENLIADAALARHFLADSLDHAHEQAVDATEDGEWLICVVDAEGWVVLAPTNDTYSVVPVEA